MGFSRVEKEAFPEFRNIFLDHIVTIWYILAGNFTHF